MTAAELIAECRGLGVELTPVGPDRIQIRPASVVPAGLREQLRQHKTEVLKLLIPDPVIAYQRVLERLWALDAQGPDADLAEGEALLQEHARLTDELGPAFAEAVARQWRRNHAGEIGACPRCGAWAPSHDVDHDGAPCPLAPDPGPPGSDA